MKAATATSRAEPASSRLPPSTPCSGGPSHAGDGAPARASGSSRAAPPAADFSTPPGLDIYRVRSTSLRVGTRSCHWDVRRHVVVAVIAALAMTISCFARRHSPSYVVTYDVFLSTTNMHNNRAYLMAVLGLLAVTRCDCRSALLRKLRRPELATSSPGWRCGCCASRPDRLRRVGTQQLLDHGGSVGRSRGSVSCSCGIGSTHRCCRPGRWANSRTVHSTRSPPS